MDNWPFRSPTTMFAWETYSTIFCMTPCTDSPETMRRPQPQSTAKLINPEHAEVVVSVSFHVVPSCVGSHATCLWAKRNSFHCFECAVYISAWSFTKFVWKGKDLPLFLRCKRSEHRDIIYNRWGIWCIFLPHCTLSSTWSTCSVAVFATESTISRVLQQALPGDCAMTSPTCFKRVSCGRASPLGPFRYSELDFFARTNPPSQPPLGLGHTCASTSSVMRQWSGSISFGIDLLVFHLWDMQQAVLCTPKRSATSRHHSAWWTTSRPSSLSPHGSGGELWKPSPHHPFCPFLPLSLSWQPMYEDCAISGKRLMTSRMLTRIPALPKNLIMRVFQTYNPRSLPVFFWNHNPRAWYTKVTVTTVTTAAAFHWQLSNGFLDIPRPQSMKGAGADESVELGSLTGFNTGATSWPQRSQAKAEMESIPCFPQIVVASEE